VSPGCPSHRLRHLRWPSFVLPRRAAGAERPPRTPEGHAGAPADLSPALRLLSLSVSLSSTEQGSPVKFDPNPIFLACFPLLPPRDHRAPRQISPRLHHPTQIPTLQRFLTSFASPRPALVELPAFPSRNCPDPMPLLAGDARGPPHRRPPISATTSANFG
jgi:hypothetical protein